jgi:hypothetical protein
MISKACHRNCAEFERERKNLGTLTDNERNVALDRMYAMDQRFQEFPDDERSEAMNFYYPRKKQLPAPQTVIAF